MADMEQQTSILQSISPATKVENAGIFASLFATFTISEWFGLITLLMGAISWIGGWIYKRAERKRAEENFKKDQEIKQKQLELLEQEKEMKQLQIDGFKERKKRDRSECKS